MKAQSLTCVNAVVLRALQTSSRLPHALVIAPDSRVLDGVKRFSRPPAVTWYFSSQSGHVLRLPTCFPALESWFLFLVVSKGVRRRELATTAVRGPVCTGQGPAPGPEEVRTGPQREGPGHRPPVCWVGWAAIRRIACMQPVNFQTALLECNLLSVHFDIFFSPISYNKKFPTYGEVGRLVSEDLCTPAAWIPVDSLL